MNIKTERLSADTIFEILRDRICLLEYPPDTVLREATLAAEFGVSRTPLRAVLQRLAYGGLIESRDGVGTIVTDLSAGDLNDIYQMRLKMAEMIGQMSPKTFTKTHKETAQALLERAKQAQQNFTIDDYWQINHSLHHLILSIIGNSALAQMWDHYYYLAVRIWYQKAQETPDEVADLLVAELREVVRAINENDATALGFSQRNYIAYGFARL